MARLARLFQDSRDSWKAKALDKRRRLRAAQVEIRDLEHSRAQWKARAPAAEGALATPRERPGRAAVSAEAATDDSSAPVAHASPAGHRYPVWIVRLTLRLYLHVALGSRGVAPLLQRLPAAVAAPTHTTVLNWLYRCGLYVLRRAVERRTDRVWIADRTIAVGPLKCLAILSLPASAPEPLGYRPSRRDLQVLAVECTVQSTGSARAWHSAAGSRCRSWSTPAATRAQASPCFRRPPRGVSTPL